MTGSEDRFLRFSGARPSAMPSPLSPWDTTAPKASANTQEAPCMLVEEKTQSADANLNSGAKKTQHLTIQVAFMIYVFFDCFVLFVC